MDAGDKIILFGSVLLVLYGIGGLVATWLLPALQRMWLFQPWMLTGTLVANNTNRTITSLLCLGVGAELGLSVLKHLMLSLVGLVFLLAIVMAKSFFATRRPDA